MLLIDTGGTSTFISFLIFPPLLGRRQFVLMHLLLKESAVKRIPNTVLAEIEVGFNLCYQATRLPDAYLDCSQAGNAGRRGRKGFFFLAINGRKGPGLGVGLGCVGTSWTV